MSDALDFESVSDNSLFLWGCSSAIDRKNGRLFILSNNPTKPFLLSYSFINNCWVSFHTYIDAVPNMIFNNRESVYAIYNNISNNSNLFIMRMMLFLCHPKQCFLPYVLFLLGYSHYMNIFL